MKKFYHFLLAAAAMLCMSVSANATGWPANYQGVMLQGFYWDSYTDTNWSNLESKADEYSQYFSLIWVPNSAKAEGSKSMGYHPVYWFTNHNSSFGTEAALRKMIATYKAKGVGIIADVVINHRSGVSNWTNFPTETWNGKTYKIGPEGICRNDEVNGVSGQAQPTGANDTGEGWSGSRDLDHTNANVQANCKDYVKCLLTDFGYAGVRYDFVKGYSAYYTKMYNQANNVQFSVGEYWDGSYDAVKYWIDGTGKESAAFDFPFKYQVNKAFANNNMTELCWKANGTTNQPAGMIHCGYAQHAVTFIDNHDTYRDGSKFTGDVVAANAFMLLSPGTPCVFLPHYKAYKSQIQTLINIRNACGIHNCSKVTVLKSAQNIYMAEIEGTKGKAVVKIGSSMESPSGYTNSDIKATGNNYCVWSKVGVTPGPDPQPSELKFFADLNGAGAWTASALTGGKYTFTVTEDSYFTFTTDGDWSGAWRPVSPNAGKDYLISANGTVQAIASGSDGCFKITAPGTYTVTPNASANSFTISGFGGDDPTPVPGDDLYIIGYVDGKDFSNTDYGIKQSSQTGKVYKWNSVLVGDAGAGLGYFNIATIIGQTGTSEDWDNFINNGIRYGAATKDAPLSVTTPADVKAYIPDVDCSACRSWAVEPGTYAVTLDLGAMKISLSGASGIEDVEINDNAPAVYYNFQGVRVDNPEGGMFIEVRGNKARKVVK